jgi:ribosome biogenesis ATPase
VSGRSWVGIGADPFQIYQVVRKLADEQAQLENGGKRLTVSNVYDSIKHSNSSLKRRSKKLLEDSIDRVLLVLREEQDDSESLDGDFDGLEDPVPQSKVGHKSSEV